MASEQKLGLWVEATGEGAALVSETALDTCLMHAERFGVSDLFIQVYREGRSWFDSRYADTEPFQAARRAGYDPLDKLIRKAASAAMRVHAWINVFNLGANAQAPILKDLGSQALQLDNAGRSVESYCANSSTEFSLDAPKYWLDPLHVQVHERLCALVGELLAQYPDLSGLHLDYIRYPYVLPIKPSSRVQVGFDFGYQPSSLSQFEKAQGRMGLFVEKGGRLAPIDERISLAWDQFRRQAISKYVRDFRAKLRSGQTLSIAAMPWPERAFYTAFQNWRTWLLEDSINVACLMAYTADDEHFGHFLRQARSFEGKNSKLWGGIGAYLLADREQLERQIALASKLSAAPVIFSYRNVLKYWS